jgi:hypothetical protein
VQVTSSVLHALRRDLLPPDRFVWATEVAVPGADRRMDVATVDTPNPTVDGFEVKVSRADWRNDTAGTKSKAARDASDRFWFVFGSKAIYKISEVPEAFGIIHVGDDHAVKIREPTRTEQPHFCRELMARILVRTLREDGQDFVRQVAATAEAKGYQKGLTAAKRRSPIIVGKTESRLKYDPGRYNYDDGIPLDLP